MLFAHSPCRSRLAQDRVKLPNHFPFFASRFACRKSGISPTKQNTSNLSIFNSLRRAFLPLRGEGKPQGQPVDLPTCSRSKRCAKPGSSTRSLPCPFGPHSKRRISTGSNRTVE